MRRDIYIERDGKRYRVITNASDCTRACSFARADKRGEKCERACYLPGWFQRLNLASACLREVTR